MICWAYVGGYIRKYFLMPIDYYYIIDSFIFALNVILDIFDTTILIAIYNNKCSLFKI